MSSSSSSPREGPSADARGERQTARLDDTGNPAPVVTAMPLDPALVDLIAARVAAQLESRGRDESGVTGASRTQPGSGASRSGEPPQDRGDLESGGKRAQAQF